MTKTAPQLSVLSNDSLESARRVLTAEADALRLMAGTLDNAFAAAVTQIAATTGRIIVTGMGKSGHVSRKIAATFASTGSPAMFVHPGEASHGDLGMITPSDLVIALSNSGETHELGDMVAYASRHSIPLVAITSGAASALAEAADILLLLPKAAEVCPMGLAPTTSTTMMLALGDALAVAVLEHKGFTADNFRNFHPGGKLGNKLKRVADLMHDVAELPLTTAATTMPDALMIMTEKSFGCVGIIDDSGKLAGIITDGDLRRHMSKNFLEQTAGDVMTKNPTVIDSRALAAEALNILNDKRRTQLFVVDETGKPVGLIHIHDLLRAGIA